MSYLRVLPRDLFNEANLLKCYGQVVLCLDKLNNGVSLAEHVDTFEILQSADDGGLYIANLPLSVGLHSWCLWRPLNSREPWPLYARSLDNPHTLDDVAVFTDEGQFTAEMLALVTASPPAMGNTQRFASIDARKGTP